MVSPTNLSWKMYSSFFPNVIMKLDNDGKNTMVAISTLTTGTTSFSFYNSKSISVQM